MAKVKLDDHICSLEFKRYVCFSFRAIMPFLVEIKQIPYFSMQIKDQDHEEHWLKSSRVIYR